MVIAICESKKRDMESVKSLVKEFYARRKLRGRIYMYRDGEELLQEADRIAFDIVLLEIRLPCMNGLAVSKALRRRNPYTGIIFISSGREYAWEAFCVGAVHYMIKPVEKKWMEEALERCRRRAHLQGTKKELEIIVNRENTIIHQDCIRYIESREKQLFIHTAFGEYRVWKTISGMEKELDGERFVKLQRSYIVHMDYIAGFHGGSCILRDGTEVGMSRKYQARIREKYKNYVKRSTGNNRFCF